RCFEAIRDVETTRETVIITKKGRPVAKLVPVEKPSRELFGCLSGIVRIAGDIEAAVVPLKAWQVLR
ncbi:MAG TPA: type II toxin-antitoxin system prevent-host-death family antitoxin, partial [Candidatus Binataceae bacterium]|nr:type II toxin-antitoxin system prevent-host-death family antitoxin [Candidatus Binataceae bacterium]